MAYSLPDHLVDKENDIRLEYFKHIKKITNEEDIMERFYEPSDKCKCSKILGVHESSCRMVALINNSKELSRIICLVNKELEVMAIHLSNMIMKRLNLVADLVNTPKEGHEDILIQIAKLDSEIGPVKMRLNQVPKSISMMEKRLSENHKILLFLHTDVDLREMLEWYEAQIKSEKMSS